jgi:hypothetical protein
MPSSARPVAAAHWPGTAIAASGTRIAASGTRIAASGTRIAAPGTRIAAPGTRIAASEGAFAASGPAVSAGRPGLAFRGKQPAVGLAPAMASAAARRASGVALPPAAAAIAALARASSLVAPTAAPLVCAIAERVTHALERSVQRQRVWLVRVVSGRAMTRAWPFQPDKRRFHASGALLRPIYPECAH